MAEQKRDYYEVLGVDKSADEAALKKAYRQLAKKYHPDMNPGDKDAEQKFKEVNEAYAVLSDSEKRSRYDQFGHAGVDGSAGAGGFGGFDFNGGGFGDIFGDIFGSFFGGGGGASRRNAPMQGDDISVRVNITFEEAAFGCKKDISFNRIEKCSDCAGSGAAKGSQAETCQTCHGTGQVRVTQRTMFGMTQTQRSCDTCHGTGKIIKEPCKNCKGKGYVRVKKTYGVTIPAGIADGQIISIRGQGDDGRNGGPAGDLLVNVSVAPHKIFERRRDNLYCDIPISFPEAALGAELTIPTLEDDVKFTIPEGTQTGTSFRIKGKGISSVNNPKIKGDLIFTVNVEVPKNLSEKEKNLLRAFAEGCGDNRYAKRKSFFDRKKK